MARTRRMNHEGSIVKKTKPDGSTRYEWRQMVDGVMRTVSAATMADLTSKINAIKDMPIASGKVRVADWNKKWLETSVLPLKKAATYDQYRIMIEKHIDPFIGKRYMKTIKPSDIQFVIAKANEAKLSSATMKHIRKVASCSFEQALKDRIVGKNPVEKIDIPVRQAKAKKVLTPAEFKAVMSALSKSRWAPSVRFALETALRRGELLALKWSDINIKEKKCTVDEALDRSATPGDTKSSKIHQVPLSVSAIRALQDQKTMLRKEGNPAIFRSRNHSEAWVFPNESGNALHPCSYYTLIAKAGKKVGVKVSPHMLRHTFVYITRGGINLKDLQNILGHEQATTTLDIYGDMLSDKTTEMAAEVDTAFAKFDLEMDAEAEKKTAGRVVRFAAKKAK